MLRLFEHLFVGKSNQFKTGYFEPDRALSVVFLVLLHKMDRPVEHMQNVGSTLGECSSVLLGVEIRETEGAWIR
jgi:hypothetical protein